MSRPAAWSPGLVRLSMAAMCSALLVIAAGCASPSPQAAGESRPVASDSWSGRLSLQVDSDPPRQYSAAFELGGNARAGELRLTSPFGQVLAQVQWQQGQALLQRGDQSQVYPDLDTLTTELVGARVPVTALFDWLQGRATDADGWEVDLGDLPSGRLRAQRLQPAPAAHLRLVIR